MKIKTIRLIKIFENLIQDPHKLFLYIIPIYKNIETTNCI